VENAMHVEMERRCPSRGVLILLSGLLLMATGLAYSAEDGKATSTAMPPLVVANGFEVEVVAAPPLVKHPIAACFDDRGRLFVAESSGEKLAAADLAKRNAALIRVLEDTDGDGKFDKSTVFAEGLSFPEGVLWHDGCVYTAAPPFVWKFEDKGAGVAGKRTVWQTGFKATHCGNEGHGPYLGPDGRIYWAKGGFTAHHLRGAGGKELTGRASHIFRCRPDGSDLEVFLSGGMDNPVGVTWSPEGELIFSCTFFTNPNQGMRDALLHGIEGGAYPKVHGVLDGVKRTGDLLPALVHLGVAAPAGVCTHQSATFGDAYRNNVFSAQFNLHKVQRHILRRSGATFESKNEDFLTSPSVDFHPTDVIEDADGSLLVVNTGGWYMICCPTSQIAKPQILGAIYRIRKKGAPRPANPRGLELKWNGATAADLPGRLDDPRPAVRKRAIRDLGKLGSAAVPALTGVLTTGSTTARRNALWALTQMDAAAARETVRKAFDDRDPSVRQVAVYSAGLHRDAAARPALCALLATATPPLRREAATALGRIGSAAAVPALLATLRPDDDRFLEHALIWALVEIADRPGLQKALRSDNPLIRRAALIALDQADDGSLPVGKVTPLLNDADARVRAAALEAITHHPAWAKETLGIVRELLSGTLTLVALDDASRLLVAFSRDTGAQAFVTAMLEDPATSPAVRRVLLEVMAQAPLKGLPPSWREQLRRSLTNADESVLRQAVATLRAAPDARTAGFAEPLLMLASDEKRPADLRVSALAAAAPLLAKLEEGPFAFLLACLGPGKPPLLRATAADALAQVKLSDEQLRRLSDALPSAGALELPRLLAAFEKGGSAAVGEALVTALHKAPTARGLRAEVLTRTFEKYPAEVRKAAAPLLARAEADRRSQQARLDELTKTLASGDAQRGRQVFVGARATCLACHSVAGQGAQIGPDLTRIAGARSERDLLEAIVFPSASFVRGYEPYQITTKDGRSFSGIIRRETAEAIVLATTATTEERIRRDAIDEIEPGKVSIMPEGLDRQLTPQELADLIAYLRTLK
jgi:putative membrane-bound dehydrogenase-like protein